MVTSRNRPRLPGRSAELAQYPGQVGLRGGACLAGRFGENVRVGIHADRFGNVRCQWDGQLAGAAAQIEQSSGPVELKPVPRRRRRTRCRNGLLDDPPTSGAEPGDAAGGGFAVGYDSRP